MEEQRTFLRSIPLGTWFGGVAVAAMALIAPLRPYVTFAALPVVAYTAYAMWRDMSKLRARVEDHVPAVEVQVQPQGPSFQEVLRAIPDPVMVVSGFEPDDIAGRWIIFANDAAQELFHLQGEGGLLVSAIRTPEVLEGVDEALFGRIPGAVTFETAGGARQQSWRAFTSPLPAGSDQHGRLALLVIRDETEIRRMERMRADFLANASHELRTPLASLTGFIETLRGPAKDDDKARDKFLSIMATQADRMGRLIQDLLSLSRIELNEHVPPAGEADLVLAVKDVVEGLSLIAQTKGVRFVILAPKPGLYPVIGERDQILQVVQNLVDNALKYAPRDSEVTVEVAFDRTLSQAMAPSDSQASKLVLLRPDRNVHDYYAVMRVRDNGPGIRREFLPRLAERFYRVEGQKSGDRLGTGLGLAIVKHIINRHRGGLSVESIGVPALADDLAPLPHDDGKIAALPIASVQTFTAFTACFPQARAFGTAAGPRLAVTEGVAAAAPLKDAG